MIHQTTNPKSVVRLRITHPSINRYHTLQSDIECGSVSDRTFTFYTEFTTDYDNGKVWAFKAKTKATFPAVSRLLHSFAVAVIFTVSGHTKVCMSSYLNSYSSLQPSGEHLQITVKQNHISCKFSSRAKAKLQKFRSKAKAKVRQRLKDNITQMSNAMRKTTWNYSLVPEVFALLPVTSAEGRRLGSISVCLRSCLSFP